MNLDDLELFARVDQDNMLAYINELPDQLENAWAYSQDCDLPDIRPIRQVVICGMGGSAISGDLLAALIADQSRVPISVVRGYELPAYVASQDTLVIGLSHSGGTEETGSVISQALSRDVPVLAITMGGNLEQIVKAGDGTVWLYSYPALPRASLGWLYGMLLGAASRLGLVEDIEESVTEAVTTMRKYQEIWNASMVAARNPAKRYAGQLVDCIPVIWGGGLLAPVARRWKTQINENSKSAAFFEEMPELNHNAVVGIAAPDELLRKHKFQIIQLISRYDHPRVALRHTLTHEMLLGEAIITDPVKARGESRLAQQMSLVLFGDYVSFYLAMAYQVDPTPIGPITRLKEMMAAAR